MTERSCATRPLKLARHLQRTRPDIIPPVEPLEGFATLLEGTDPSMKFLLRDALGPAGMPTTRAAPAGPMFSGGLVVVRLQVVAGSRRFAIGPEGGPILESYLSKAQSVLARYLRPYGSAEFSVGLAPGELVLNAPRGLYNDTTLCDAVDGYVRSEGLDRARTGVVVLAPPGPLNTDADPGRGSMGYHAAGSVPYAFVNVGPGPLALGDGSDAFALALSHGLAELVADPGATLERPEVCDPCGPGCRAPVRCYFDVSGAYLGASSAFPPAFPYAFFVSAVSVPAAVGQCPAPDGACAYPPPTALPSTPSTSA